MTNRLSTTVRASLSVAVATVVALGLIALSSGRAGAATEPTLTLERNCEIFRDDGADAIDIRLTGFPPFTPFEGTLRFPSGGGVGPVDEVTDANGTFEISSPGDFKHGTWTVKIIWSGGTLTQSLYVDCTEPDGAVTVIPPDDYSPCSPNGEALQGHGDDDTIDGTPHLDLLRGGGGEDSLSGEALQDCLFGQGGADAVSGQEGGDYILGQRGADELKGGPGRDRIEGGDGADTISGGKANDHILDTDGRNRISCGKGIDRVKTIAKSKVAANCEHVHIRREF